jgi:hypothetical protein
MPGQPAANAARSATNASAPGARCFAVIAIAGPASVRLLPARRLLAPDPGLPAAAVARSRRSCFRSCRARCCGSPPLSPRDRLLADLGRVDLGADQRCAGFVGYAYGAARGRGACGAHRAIVVPAAAVLSCRAGGAILGAAIPDRPHAGPVARDRRLHADADHRDRGDRRCRCRSASCWRSAGSRTCRSSRRICVGFIEFIRGVPLITLLFTPR